ncbi:MAG: hypothetical protein WD749_00355 [Phycisphaerales bacterium]
MADESHAHMTAAKARWQGIVIGLVVGILLGAILGVLLPEVSRQPPGAPAMPGKAGPRRVQDTPILCSVSGEGEARVLELRNNHRDPLENVVVEATRAGNTAAGRVPVGTIAANSTKTLTGADWDWKVQTGDVFEVSAEGFAPITFTAP